MHLEFLGAAPTVTGSMHPKASVEDPANCGDRFMNHPG